jgi:hypothetical protein
LLDRASEVGDGERDLFLYSQRPLLADSVEKIGFGGASRSGVPAAEVAVSHFKLPFGVSLSVLAQVLGLI